MRSGGLLVGVASLRHEGVGSTRPLRAGGAPDARCEDTSGAYLSGFRIVRDASSATRHAEYRVVLVNARYERWHRFSEIKALAGGLLSTSGDSIPAASREAWDTVRACKAPKRRVLDPTHLSRKCLAIEIFLSSLLVKLCAFELAGLLTQVPAQARAAPLTKSWAPSGYLGAAHATMRTRGIRAGSAYAVNRLGC